MEELSCATYELVELAMTIRLVVFLLLLFEKWIWNVDLELDIQILGVDFVEYIDKRSIFDFETTTNR